MFSWAPTTTLHAVEGMILHSGAPSATFSSMPGLYTTCSAQILARANTLMRHSEGGWSRRHYVVWRRKRGAGVWKCWRGHRARVNSKPPFAHASRSDAPSALSLTKDLLKFALVKIINSATLNPEKAKKLRVSASFVVFLIARRTVCTR
jgi:hypothetical protein